MTIPDQAKNAGDLISVTTVGATLMDYFPPAAAVLTVIWLAMRMFESDTVRKLLRRNKRTRATDSDCR